MKDSASQKFFVKKILTWNEFDNKREMPWKGEKDPYKIWLSEIILQQTRVEQGLAYYNRFILQYPTVKHLAKAPETAIFKLWEGLGYYTRCKNLIATAKYISVELKGQFPDQYEDILALKGIGPYTAAAIGSFAFNLSHAVVDGNVFRVLSRFFGIATPIDSTEGKKEFTALANILLDKKQPGIYNQALMDFGAIVCKPQLPLCNECVLQSNCHAYQHNLINVLPIKEKSIKKKTRWFYFLLVEYKGALYVRKRGAKDIWENLYEFILIENEAALPLEDLSSLEQIKKIFKGVPYEITQISKPYKQLLTHQAIHGQFIKIKASKPLLLNDYELVRPDEIAKLPFPKFITSYLRDKNVSLNLL
ncbi:MAG: A/G-specific adenine glycosylase [Sphingobacteriales bacterium]|nr:A/G-specific adenine glycosylase [Sphingobacteriales bacterium]